LALHNKKIKARRNQVASLLSKSFSETEIAQQLGVDQSTISRDIKQSINGIEEAKKESWKIYNDQTVPIREKLLALKLIIQSDETRFKLLSEGPGLLAIKSLEDRLNRIERMGEQR
jgi:predicted DNA-binding protein YlxM (UPF0122 family)